MTPTTDCVTCGRPVDTELAICTPCLDDAQQTIRDTATLIADMPETTREVMGLRAIRYDKPPAAGTPDDGDLPFGLNVIYDDPEDPTIRSIRRPDTALDILHGWAAGWADQRGDTVGNVFDYLIANTRWAAQHDAGWTDYLKEARQVHNVIRRLAGLNPQSVPTPCPRCGGRVIQAWDTTTGLDDQHTCTGCRVTWDGPGPFIREAVETIADLPTDGPDMLVTTDEARLIHPDLKRGTLNIWIHRDKVTQMSTHQDGRPLYRLGDITKLHHGDMDAAPPPTEGSAA